MLLLDRRYGESIIIGDNIRVTIFQRPGNKVCVGVLAPRDVPVNREEVHRRAQQKTDGVAPKRAGHRNGRCHDRCHLGDDPKA